MKFAAMSDTLTSGKRRAGMPSESGNIAAVSLSAAGVSRRHIVCVIERIT
jgi:hypothetical protein